MADIFGLVVRRDLEFDSLAQNLDDLGFGVDLVARGGGGPLRSTSEFPKFCLTADPNQFTDSCRPVPQEGRLAIVTNAGRDAVDVRASGAQGNRRAR
jgi:hypothetical protein